MTTTIPAGGIESYLPDRYDRLRNGAEIIASDPNIESADPLMNGESLRAFIGDLVEHRVLDGLTDRDADTVSMLTTLDFLKGPAHMANRIGAWLAGDRIRDDDNTWAVCAVLAEILTLFLAPFAGSEFEEARAAARWPDRETGETESVGGQ